MNNYAKQSFAFSTTKAGAFAERMRNYRLRRTGVGLKATDIKAKLAVGIGVEIGLDIEKAARALADLLKQE